MRAGIYARISEDREETQAGVERQLADCATVAGGKGWEVIDHYVDNDISAWRGKRRPEYERLKADIEDGRINAVAVYHADRLHRQPRELEDFILLCDRHGIALASVTGDYDLSTGDGRFKARIEGAVAAKESDDKSRRIRRKMLQLAQDGATTGGGTRPFGFEADRVTVRESEAAIIRELAGRLIAGESLRTLCVDLAARGITAPSGKPWSPTPLRRMLRSGRISGQREHHGEIVAEAAWPAIIAPEQTTQIRAILDDPSRRTARAPRSYLLSGGLVRCSHCGAPLVSRPRDDGQRRYVCAKGPRYIGCGKAYALAEPLEQLVSEAVLYALDTPALADALHAENAESAAGVQTRVDQLTAQMDELAEAYGAGQIGMREWLTAREPLQEQLDDAKRSLARESRAGVLNGFVGHGEALRAAWPSLSLDRKRAIISAVLQHVVVGPAVRGRNRFDPDRFDLVWRYA